MTDSEELRPLVSRLSQSGRRRILLNLVIKEARRQKRQEEEGKISYSEISPMKNATEVAGISAKEYRNYLSREVEIPTEPVCNCLAQFDPARQKDLIMMDLEEILLELQKISSDQDSVESPSGVEVGQWGISSAWSRLKKQGDHYFWKRIGVEFKLLDHCEFKAEEDEVESFLGEDYEGGYEGGIHSYKFKLDKRANLPRLKNSPKIKKEIKMGIKQTDLRDKSRKQNWPFEFDGILHNQVLSLALHMKKKPKSILERINYVASVYSITEIERLKEICDIRLFNDDLKNKLITELTEAIGKINRE